MARRAQFGEDAAWWSSALDYAGKGARAIAQVAKYMPMGGNLAWAGLDMDTIRRGNKQLAAIRENRQPDRSRPPQTQAEIERPPSAEQDYGDSAKRYEPTATTEKSTARKALEASVVASHLSKYLGTGYIPTAYLDLLKMTGRYPFKTAAEEAHYLKQVMAKVKGHSHESLPTILQAFGGIPFSEKGETRTRTTRKKGWGGINPVTHRKYNRRALRRRFKTGRLTYVGTGEGHRAGEAWGAEKQIDPRSRVTKYSKNSPSFDEGVWVYKEKNKGDWHELPPPLPSWYTRRSPPPLPQFSESPIMPRGTKVDDIYQALRRKGYGKGKAARIAQSRSGQALATGQPPQGRRAKQLSEDAAALLVEFNAERDPNRRHSLAEQSAVQFGLGPHEIMEMLQHLGGTLASHPLLTSGGALAAVTAASAYRRLLRSEEKRRRRPSRAQGAQELYARNKKEPIAPRQEWPPRPRQYAEQFDIEDPRQGRLQGFLRQLLDHIRLVKTLPDEQFDQMKEALKIEAANQGISYKRVTDWISKKLRNMGPPPGDDPGPTPEDEDDIEQMAEDSTWWATQFVQKDEFGRKVFPKGLAGRRGMLMPKQLSEDAVALLAEFRAERDPNRRRSLAEQAVLQFGLSPDELLWHAGHLATVFGAGGLSAYALRQLLKRRSNGKDPEAPRSRKINVHPKPQFRNRRWTGPNGPLRNTEDDDNPYGATRQYADVFSAEQFGLWQEAREKLREVDPMALGGTVGGILGGGGAAALSGLNPAAGAAGAAIGSLAGSAAGGLYDRFRKKRAQRRMRQQRIIKPVQSAGQIEGPGPFDQLHALAKRAAAGHDVTSRAQEALDKARDATYYLSHHGGSYDDPNGPQSRYVEGQRKLVSGLSSQFPHGEDDEDDEGEEWKNQFSEDHAALAAEFRAERDPKRRRSLASQARYQFNEDWYEEPNWRGEPEVNPYHFRGESADFDRPDVPYSVHVGAGRRQMGGLKAPNARIADEDVDQLSHLQKMQAITERLEMGGVVHPQLVQELLDRAAHIANRYMYPAGPTLGGGSPMAYDPAEGHYGDDPDYDDDERSDTARPQDAYRHAAAKMMNAWHKRGAQMSESADAYQGRLVAQYPSVYQPIQFGEKPPNLMIAEHLGTSCASCKHFKPAGGEEVDDQGRCALYDYIVKARMACDAWTPTKEQQDFRGPGIMLDRKGGDPQHGGTSQMSEAQFGMLLNAGMMGGAVPRMPNISDLLKKRRLRQLQQRVAESRAMEQRAGALLTDPNHASRLARDRGFFPVQQVADNADYDLFRQSLGIPDTHPDATWPAAVGHHGMPEHEWHDYEGDETGPEFDVQIPRATRLRRASQLSEDAAHFAGYEEHLLQTMPERYR